MNLGFIGTGNMGKILIHAFLESKAIKPSHLFIHNRTKAKAERIKLSYPEVEVLETPSDVVKQADIIFICVKPLDIQPLLAEISHQLTRDKCIVSITSPISTDQLESEVSCNVVRVIPSITNRALAGISLVTYGVSCDHLYREVIERLMSNISTPILIDDSITRVSSDIVSCGPAFFSFLLQRFIEGATNVTAISKEQATELASGMIVGMGKLIEKEIFTLPTLQEKVCVKGGVTGEGIKAMEEDIGKMFEHLFQKTHEKYDEDKEHVKKQFHHT
jgi:competence protein ComER